MSIRLSRRESSDRISDPDLLATHNRREEACFELQKNLNDGVYSLSDAVAKIERLTERVISLGKKYQEEKQKKQLTVAPESLYKQQEEFLQELGTYNEVYIKGLTLIETTKSTISYIEPPHRGRSDEKFLREHSPFYYAELKYSESLFLKYVEQFKKTEASLSSLNRRLLTAIEGRGLKLGLEKFNKIAEQQATPSSKRRLFSPVSLPRTPVILEPQEQPRVPFSSARRASVSPLQQTSLTPPLAFRQSPEGLCSLSREPHKKRPSTSSQELLDQSSPRTGSLAASWEIRKLSLPPTRVEISPARAISILSPLEIARSPRREAIARLVQSDGSSSFRDRPTSLASSSPRDRPTRFSHSAEPPTRQRTLLPPIRNRRYEQDTPSPDRGRRLYSRKTYETAGATQPYSGSRY